MSLLRNIASGLRSWFRKEQVDRELEEEEQESAKGSLLLNRCGKGYGHYLEFKVKYHEKMCADGRREHEAWKAKSAADKGGQQLMTETFVKPSR
jgi:hypothetical protein